MQMLLVLTKTRSPRSNKKFYKLIEILLAFCKTFGRYLSFRKPIAFIAYIKVQFSLFYLGFTLFQKHFSNFFACNALK